MPRPFVAKIVTANDLLKGDVIYLTDENSWSRNLGDARVCFSRQEADELLETALSQQHLVVGPYLAEVKTRNGRAEEPLHFREKFRSLGPSNYFHGKQEQNRQQGAA